MSTPNMRYYAKLEYAPNSPKTPKYIVTAQFGYYQPMEQLKNKKGLISMYLLEKLKEGENIPAMRLQAKDSLNFTGLKDFFVDGRLSGYAYGYPFEKEVYGGKKKKSNPFFQYKEDGFLFMVHQNQKGVNEVEKIRPDYIELIVLEGAKVLISSYCKMLQMGGFDEDLRQLRKQAQQVEDL